MTNRDIQNGIEEMAMGFLAIIAGIVVGIAVTIIMAFCGYFAAPVAAEEPVDPPALQIEIDYENDVDLPAEETEETDSGDSELAHIKFVNAVDRFTGWSDLSMDEQAVRVKAAGLIIETAGKMTPQNPITGGFMHSLLRNVGVQMQVQAMYHLDELSHDPYISAAQGFLVGL